VDPDHAHAISIACSTDMQGCWRHDGFDEYDEHDVALTASLTWESLWQHCSFWQF